MRNFRTIIGIMMFVLAASLCVSSIAYAKGQRQGKTSLPTLQAELDQEKIDRANEDADLQQQIDTIELKKGLQGDKGDQGVAGTDGADGATGPAGADGDDGDTQWTDESSSGYNSISTIGSIKIGDDFNADYCDSRNEGTIRFNTVTKKFEGCDGTVWEL